VEKPEGRPPLLGQSAPVVARGLEQCECPHDIGLDELTGTVDRAVDVAFGGEVHHRIGLVLGQKRGHQRSIADVAMHEHVVRVALQRRQRMQVAGVGQGVEVDDPDAAGYGFEHEVAANEAGTAGN